MIKAPAAIAAGAFRLLTNPCCGRTMWGSAPHPGRGIIPLHPVRWGFAPKDSSLMVHSALALRTHLGLRPKPRASRLARSLLLLEMMLRRRGRFLRYLTEFCNKLKIPAAIAAGRFCLFMLEGRVSRVEQALLQPLHLGALPGRIVPVDEQGHKKAVLRADRDQRAAHRILQAVSLAGP